MLSPLYQELGGLVVCPHTSSSSSQGIRRPPRCHPPPISGSSVGPNPTYYHTVYDVQVDQYADVPFPVGGGGYGARFGRKPLSLVTNDSTVPPIRRRGGLVDHRDVILAHQAHKLHNTPQARRKQWEWVRPNLMILWFSSIETATAGLSFLGQLLVLYLVYLDMYVSSFVHWSHISHVW